MIDGAGMKHLTRSAAMLAAIAMTGCTSWPTQTITISTSPAAATCVVEQSGRLIAVIGPTPARAELPRLQEPVRIECIRPEYGISSAVLYPEVPNDLLTDASAGGARGQVVAWPVGHGEVHIPMALRKYVHRPISDAEFACPAFVEAPVEALSPEGAQLVLRSFESTNVDFTAKSSVYVDILGAPPEAGAATGRGSARADRLPDGTFRLTADVKMDNVTGRSIRRTEAKQIVLTFDVDGNPISPKKETGKPRGVVDAQPRSLLLPDPEELGIEFGVIQTLLPRSAPLHSGDLLTLVDRTSAVREGGYGHAVLQTRVSGRTTWRGRRVLVADYIGSATTPKEVMLPSEQLCGFALIDIETGWIVHEDIWWGAYITSWVGNGHAVSRVAYSILVPDRAP